nr:hypothetical protein [Tanacetum cinerariifolium]
MRFGVLSNLQKKFRKKDIKLSGSKAYMQRSDYVKKIVQAKKRHRVSKSNWKCTRCSKECPSAKITHVFS